MGEVPVEDVIGCIPLPFIVMDTRIDGASAKGVYFSFLLYGVGDHSPMKGIGNVSFIEFWVCGNPTILEECFITEKDTRSHYISIKID